jgi:peptide/nickel transport system ATP-binding protein
LSNKCEEEVPPEQIDSEGHLIACHIPLDELRAIEPVIKVAS